ncbi:P-loop containing nucleoside triphosphate hydrolase protein [Lipomyces tetrasporus]|uniref:Replication factor C subunit 2 n=1 Tax=Lipomyces tetrasporus TaxID=54092 RepID=A0AAD7QMA9_9ASCO|nr:P-loop containing nucleoside triphosphate hydrolase protein [Lipomyces tetrasporus]KAJ8097947.1 P-loop containing nucleoside triphosphate hydrolase protein [Lipomyces tetrasporus]
MSFFKKSTSTTTKAVSQPRQVPWVEKYRPESLDDVSSQDHAVSVLKRTLESSNLPHMLFYGPPGTGKTSTILALAKQLYGPDLMRSRVLELNASDERGISIVREKVKNFARAAVSTPSAHTRENYPCPPYKLIILDEADSMTQDAQSALRRTMETYSRITRFCLICNYVTRIIDPLASRCSKFRFKPLDTGNAVSRLQDICQKEGVKYEDGVIESILQASDGDLRKAITLLQSAAKLHGAAAAALAADPDSSAMQVDPDPSVVTVGSVEEISGRVPHDVITGLVRAALNRSGDRFAGLQTAVEDVILDGWSAAQIVVQVHEELVLSDDFGGSEKNKIVAAISEIDKRLLDGANEHLSILDLMVKISGVLTAK